MRKDWGIFVLLGAIAAVWLALIVGYYVYKAKFQPHYKNYSEEKVEVNILHPPPPPEAAGSREEHCSAGAEHLQAAQCRELQRSGADTVVDMQPDGSCRVCSDLANDARAP